MSKHLPDVRIIRGAFICSVIPLSMKGHQWIIKNMYRAAFEVSITVPMEFIDELIEELEEDLIIVERSG